MNLLIAGDLVPTITNEDLFTRGDILNLIGKELNEIWYSADIRIFNLEVPLSNRETPIPKCGPNLIAPEDTINGIKELKPTLITLANNHIMDQGIEGLHSTQKLLNQFNIPFVGVGDNLYKAPEPYILKKNGISIGVYACAENEFTIATENSPGANPFDPLESFDHIEILKSKCDYVVVLYHGGKEHYRYPSPYLQKVCRKMVQKGANLVICQHSHSVGCYENHQDSTIIYGQGNFIFDKSDSEFWQTSILLNIEIKDRLSVNYIPIVKKENVIQLAHGNEAEKILNDFHKRSSEICQEWFVEQQYQKFASENIEGYLRKFSGLGKWASRIDRKLLNGLILRNIYSKSNLLAIQNFIECEAHRELVLKGIKQFKN
jgi:hypothetical protein